MEDLRSAIQTGLTRSEAGKWHGLSEVRDAMGTDGQCHTDEAPRRLEGRPLEGTQHMWAGMRAKVQHVVSRCRTALIRAGASQPLRGGRREDEKKEREREKKKKKSPGHRPGPFDSTK